MPYEIRKKGDKFQVVTKDSGNVHGEFETEEAAKKQLAALYANANPKNERVDGLVHFDAGRISKVETTREGWLRVGARIARVGIQEYSNPDGTVRREFRSPDEVFKASALESFALRPVTDDHPWAEQPPLLSAENASRYARGSVGETVRAVGPFVDVPTMLITDKGLIDKIKAGVVEVSAGYRADTIPEQGEWRGKAYTHVQRNIQGNHVAIVPRGRAGDDVRLKLDSAGTVAIGRIVEEAPDDASEVRVGAKLKIDGIDVEFASEQGPQIVERALAARADALRNARCDKCDAMLECPKCGAKATEKDIALAAAQRAGDAEKGKADQEKAKADTEKARADAAEKALADERKAHADAAAKADADAKAARHAALVERARPHLPKDFKVDGATDGDLRTAALKTLVTGFDPAGRGDAYLEARFDAELERAEARDAAGKKGIARAREATAPPPVDGTPGEAHADADEAAKRFREEAANAWRKPIGARMKGGRIVRAGDDAE